MSDAARRSALLERSTALRARAAEFDHRLKDAKAKEFLRTMVFHHLDDVDRFFLGDAKSRPSMDMWETMWLDSAETMLRIAEDSFGKFESQVQRYGGPEHVQLVG
jgi:hypothetical protein